MLVDVVPLRIQGLVRPRHEVLTAAPVRGHLAIVRTAPGYPRRAFLTNSAEQTTASNAASVLHPLSDVIVTRMAGDSFIVAGIERLEHFSSETSFHQSWWCRLVQAGADGKHSD
jgi:hypothetical protein